MTMHEIKTHEGNLTVVDGRFAIVASRFNDFIVRRLVDGPFDKQPVAVIMAASMPSSRWVP